MKILFKSGQFKLRGNLLLNGKRLIILSHGFSTNRKHRFISFMSRRLNESGFSTLRFDLTGRGESEGSFKDGMPSKHVKDLGKAIKYASKYSRRIGLVGHSLGGMISLMNSANKMVKAVVSISSVYDPEKTIKDYRKSSIIRRIQARRAGKQFVNDLLTQDVDLTVKKLKKPLLIINGERDRVVNMHQAINMYNDASGIKSIKVIKDCGHNFIKPVHRNKVTKLVIKWFEKYL